MIAYLYCRLNETSPVPVHQVSQDFVFANLQDIHTNSEVARFRHNLLMHGTEQRRVQGGSPWVVQGTIHVDEQIVGVTVIDVEVADCHTASIQPLKASYI